MSEIAFESEMENIASDAFAGRVPLNPYSKAGFSLRFLSFMFELQRYYNQERESRRGALVESTVELLESYKDLKIDNGRMREYLQNNLRHLRRRAPVVLKRHAWRSQQLSKRTMAVPGMLYLDTMRYYKWLAKTARGHGEIVELGCWMGLSTSCLAEGLRENPDRGRRKIRVFDAFRWQSWMELFCTDPQILGAGLKDGDSFLDLFWKFCQSHRGLLDVRAGLLGMEVGQDPLQHSRWSTDRIEVIIFDISDDYATHKALWQLFRPHFIPEKTVVVFNQFGNARADAIRCFCAEREKQLLPLHKPIGSAKGFRYIGGKGKSST